MHHKLDEIRNEILTNPNGYEYADKSYEEILEMLLIENITVRRIVPNWRIKQYVIETGMWGVISLIAAGQYVPDVPEGVEPPAIPQIVRILCINVKDWIDDRTGQIQNTDMDLVSTQMMLGGLVASGILTSDQSAGISALADTVISRAEQLKLLPLTVEDIRDALL